MRCDLHADSWASHTMKLAGLVLLCLAFCAVSVTAVESSSNTDDRELEQLEDELEDLLDEEGSGLPSFLLFWS